MRHRYRNPYKHWVREKNLKIGQEYKCVKLINLGGEPCDDIEWDFPTLDWE